MGFTERRFRICYLNSAPHVVDIHRASLERNLQLLFQFDVVAINGLNDPSFSPCDLLVVAAERIQGDKFTDWLKSFANRIQRQGSIWVPALIVAEVANAVMRDLIENAVGMNWYFDIVSPDQLDSLPIRIANLLRIHDHLHELRRYSKTIQELTDTVDGLQAELLRLQAKG